MNTLTFKKHDVRYEPYPIIYFNELIEPEIYRKLLANWPDTELFVEKPGLGSKYSLSERNNKSDYLKFIKNTPCWKNFYNFIKSPDFIESTLLFLKQKNIDLYLPNYKTVSKSHKRSSSILSRLNRVIELNARFEFSMMDAHLGNILPHTDDPNKIITIVISMIKQDEWDPSWGGGTQICSPKDKSLLYNFKNKYLNFHDVDIIDEFPFVPNQGICFIKTHNSWHQVAPLRGPMNGPLRKTITLNIEVIK